MSAAAERGRCSLDSPTWVAATRYGARHRVPLLRSKR